jgi:hypothetical protein
MGELWAAIVVFGACFGAIPNVDVDEGGAVVVGRGKREGLCLEPEDCGAVRLP